MAPRPGTWSFTRTAPKPGGTFAVVELPTLKVEIVRVGARRAAWEECGHQRAARVGLATILTVCRVVDEAEGDDQASGISQPAGVRGRGEPTSIMP